jgi:hypothetical protein
MKEANVSIINELKKFINEVVTKTSIKETYCYSKTAFTRNRVLTLPNIICLIIGTLKRSLTIEIQTYLKQFSEAKSCTKQAFCEQRVKLKATFFQAMNQILVTFFYLYYGEIAKRWKGKFL